MSGSSIAEHKAEFLKPSQLFLETMKGDYYNPVFLGFSFTDKHVRLAISDDCNANTYWDAYKFGPSRSELPRNDNLLNKLVDILQCLKDDTVEKYHLPGVVVVDNSVVMKLDIHDLMDNLCKKGNFGILKYTCWKDNIATDNPTFVCNRFGSLFWGVTFPVERSELRKHQEVMSAEQMLQGFLDFFDTIYYMDKDEEMVDEDRVREDKDEVREDKGLEMEDSERKMEYLKPVDFYKGIFKDILKKEDYLKPGRLLGLDVSDKYVSLAVSDWKNKTAVPLRALDRLEINMDSMADMIQSLISEHNLVGFVVGSKRARPMDAQTRTFIDNLCKTEKVQGLKYTVWEFGITSKNAEFVFKQHLKFILENLPQPQPQPPPQQPQPRPKLSQKPQPQPQDMSQIIMEKCYAVCALQGYLDCTNKMVKEDWD